MCECVCGGGRWEVRGGGEGAKAGGWHLGKGYSMLICTHFCGVIRLCFPQCQFHTYAHINKFFHTVVELICGVDILCLH